MRLWEVKTGKLLKTWEFATSIKRVEFSSDGKLLLGVTEKRSGHLSTIVVYEINPDPAAEQTDEQALRIVCDESKATVAGFSYLSHYIISGHEDGSVSQWDAKTGELLFSTQVHEDDMQSTRSPGFPVFHANSHSYGSPVGTGPYILHHGLKRQDSEGGWKHHSLY